MNSKKREFINRYKEGIMNLPKKLAELFFPDAEECNICGREGEIVCTECLGEMESHSGILCLKCGRSVNKKGLCPACEKHKRPYDQGAIAFFYQGTAQQAMKEYKFENKLFYSQYFAEGIFDSIKGNDWEIDIIAPIPIHPLKLMLKGYNPPALIAKKLAKMVGAEYEPFLLRRTRYTKSMSLLKGIDRMEHSKKNFAVKNNVFKNKNVLIVDDVSTTGSTLHVCAEILKKNGAGKVYVAAACGDAFRN